jgi:hypothetical protein
MTRKNILLVTLALLVTGGIFAQTQQMGGKWYNSYAPGFDTRSVFINVIGAGLPAKSYDGGQIPPVMASLDWKFPLIRTAPITIGVQSGYHYGKDSGQEFHHIPLAARAAYHFNLVPTLDVYLLGSLGYTFERIDDGDFLSTEKGGGLFTGGGAGVRWLPGGIPVGIFAEFNYNSLFYGTAGFVLVF